MEFITQSLHYGLEKFSLIGDYDFMALAGYTMLALFYIRKNSFRIRPRIFLMKFLRLHGFPFMFAFCKSPNGNFSLLKLKQKDLWFSAVVEATSSSAAEMFTVWSNYHKRGEETSFSLRSLMLLNFQFLHIG